MKSSEKVIGRKLLQIYLKIQSIYFLIKSRKVFLKLAAKMFKLSKCGKYT